VKKKTALKHISEFFKFTKVQNPMNILQDVMEVFVNERPNCNKNVAGHLAFCCTRSSCT